MKKMIVFCAGLMLASFHNFGAGKADENVAPRPLDVRQLQDERVKIKKEELPEAARKTLESDPVFKDWQVSGAYKTKNGEFEVELKNGTQSKTVKFDKEGRLKS